MKYGYTSLSKKNINFIEGLGIYKIITLENKKICLAHGTPYNVRESALKDSYEIFDRLIKDFDCDIYLSGHEHQEYLTIYKNRYFINPGSIGIPTYSLAHTYGILDIKNNAINYELINVDYDYELLQNYYRGSEYHKVAYVWCELILRTLKSKNDHTSDFLDFVKIRATEKNIDISNNIPNTLYVESFNEYIKNEKNQN